MLSADLFISILCVTALLLLSGPATGSTIIVPDHYPSIQGAIDASADGDIVLVRKGTFHENIDFLGKAIRLKSIAGPANTVIDGDQLDSVVTFNSGEGFNSIIEGFSITNGSPNFDGGGIYCHQSSPTITGNRIWQNYAGDDGGGIYCSYSFPVIIGNDIEDNSVRDDGGGLFFHQSSPTVTGNRISGNRADSRGGGICCYLASPLLLENDIASNTALAEGGGICCDNGSEPLITDNTIADNAADRGGGVFCFNAEPTITKSLILDNTALKTGGAIHCLSSFPLITGNTVTGNSAADRSGGIAAEDSSSPVVKDSIFWNNTAPAGPEIGVENSSLWISYSDVTGGLPAAYVCPNSTLSWGSGMIDVDPLFLAPQAGDFRLQQDPCQTGVANRCVDGGDPGSDPVDGSTRSDGVKDDLLVDIGYHYPVTYLGVIYHVPDDFASIQVAVDSVEEGDTIVVRPGTYVERIDFLGKEVCLKSEKGAAVTVIDGNGGGSVVTFQTRETPKAIVEGFTLTNGTGTPGTAGRLGGGIYCSSASPTIVQNIITKNVLTGDSSRGGGIYCSGDAATISGNTIHRNKLIGSNGLGGGIYCVGSNATISQNRIAANLADHNGSGGGICCGGDSVTVRSNIITGNTAWGEDSRGGGIDIRGKATVTGNLIYSNQVVDKGGGIHIKSGSSSITSCSLTGNSAQKGGGIFITFSYLPRITNTIVWGNDALSEPEIGGGGAPAVTFCNVKGGYTGAGNIDADPLWLDPAIGDFHLTFGSPCREAGTETTPYLPEIDFEGDPRVAAKTTDIGADEFYTHLYCTGDPAPQGVFDIKITGLPQAPVTLALGSGVIDPPRQTRYGSLHLRQPIGWLGIGTIPRNGILIHPVTVPSFWSPGEEKPLQAFVRQIGYLDESLTNLMVVTVK